jgi:phosphoadenosine phosphosulfate reductase
MKLKEMQLHELKDQLKGLTMEDQLRKLVLLFPGKVIFTTSLGVEDQVITHKVFTNDIDIRVITLDTGRLFRETYDVLSKTVIKYKKRIEVFFPGYEAVEKMVTEKGPYSFYNSVEDRKECCSVRKLVPLDRALTGMKVWISGIRSGQSSDRSQLSWLEYDEPKKMFKFYPLFYWSLEDVEDFIKENNLPYNSLHDKGYVSIGCEPCTKAIKKGEDFRAGRWWWENDGTKECGLHSK